jgi:hypothetical protein
MSDFNPWEFPSEALFAICRNQHARYECRVSALRVLQERQHPLHRHPELQDLVEGKPEINIDDSCMRVAGQVDALISDLGSESNEGSQLRDIGYRVMDKIVTKPKKRENEQ